MLHNMDTSHLNYSGLKNIEQQVKSGAELSKQLLGYARKGNYEVQAINLNQLVDETSRIFSRTRKEITIHRELSSDLYNTEADKGQIERVLLNLYVNAADAMHQGGDLILKTMNTTHQHVQGRIFKLKPGDYVCLMVTDTGTGMDKKTQERIFEPFFTTKEMGRGTGLGLASVYGIIKGHGGYIDLESENGVGTTFSVFLPASDETIHEIADIVAPVKTGSGTVLMVDDEEIVLEVGIEMLKILGYEPLAAKGGNDAIDLYKKKQGKVDLVILDMIMPEKGGGEVYDSIKEIDPNAKVLLSSGYSIDGQATEILKRGCNGFIQKPFNMQELSQKLSELSAE